MRLLGLFFFLFGSLYANDWSGLKFNWGTGAYVVARKQNEDDEKKVRPCLEAGLEYGFSFGCCHRYYLGADLIFHADFPDSFEKKDITFTKKGISPIYIPIIDLYFGYSVTPKTQVFLGTTYLWGLNGGFRSMVTERTYFLWKTVYWADRDIFHRGIHDFYSVIGFGRFF